MPPIPPIPQHRYPSCTPPKISLQNPPTPCGSAGVCYRFGSASPSYCPPLWPFRAVTRPPLPPSNISPVTLEALRILPKKTYNCQLASNTLKNQEKCTQSHQKTQKRHPKPPSGHPFNEKHEKVKTFKTLSFSYVYSTYSHRISSSFPFQTQLKHGTGNSLPFCHPTSSTYDKRCQNASRMKPQIK